MSDTPMIWPLGYGFEAHDFFLGLDELERGGVPLTLVQQAFTADFELATYHVCLLAFPTKYPENAKSSLKGLLKLAEVGGAL